MTTRIKIIIIYFIFIYNNISAQVCLPASSLNISISDVNENALKSIILDKMAAGFTKNQVNSEREKMEKCNRLLNDKLSKIESEKSSFSQRYIELARYLDVKEIRHRLDKQSENKVKAIDQLEKSLADTRQSGLFVVLLTNIDFNSSMEEFRSQAQQVLSHQAIEDLNGEIVKRTTSTANLKEVKDIIESIKKGVSFEESNFINKTNFDKKYFLYFTRTAVKPLKENDLNEGTSLNENVYVYNLEHDSNYGSSLRAKGVSEAHMVEIESRVKNQLEIIHKDNETQNRRRSDLVNLAEVEINKIEFEIKEAKDLLRNRSKKIKEICSELKIEFNDLKADECARTAQATIENNILELEKQWDELKSNEVQNVETTVEISNSVADDLPKYIFDMVKKLNSTYGKITKAKENLKVTDLQTTEFKRQEEVSIRRSVNRIWLYPVPGDDGNFKLFVFATFDLTNSGPIDNPTSSIEIKNNEIFKEKVKKENKFKSKINNLISKVSYANVQYHYNRNYNLVDVGVRWGTAPGNNNDTGGPGLSIGWYWKGSNVSGVALTTNLSGSSEFLYGAIDAKAGIGNGSFLAVQPRIGFTLAGKLYVTCGYEFSTGSRPAFGIQFGLDFPF